VHKAGEAIDLSDVIAITDFNDLSNNHLTQDGNDAIIDSLDGNTIRLEDVDVEDLTTDHFIF